MSDGMVPQGLRDGTSARSLEGEEESRVDFRTGALRTPPLRLRNKGPWDRRGLREPEGGPVLPEQGGHR